MKQWTQTLAQWGDEGGRAFSPGLMTSSPSVTVYTHVFGGFKTQSTLRWELGTTTSISDTYWMTLQHSGQVVWVNGTVFDSPTMFGGPRVEKVLTTIQEDPLANDCTTEVLEGFIYSWHTARPEPGVVASATDEGHFYCQSSGGPGGYDNIWFGDDDDHSEQQIQFDPCEYVSEPGAYDVYLDGEFVGTITC